MEALARFEPSLPAGSPFAHLGVAAGVAYHPLAPADEVEDASQELLGLYGSALPDLGTEVGLLVRDWVRLEEAERLGNRLLAKALRMVHPGAKEAKARTESLLASAQGQGRWLRKPGLSFEALRQAVRRIEVAQAFHRTRRRQVLRFSEPSQKDDVVGFRLRHQDPNHVLSQDESAYLEWLTSFLLSGGREFRTLPRRKLGRVGLRTFLAQLVDDALTLDHGAVETVPLRGMEGLDAFFVRDSATFFLAGQRQGAGDLFAIQVAAGLEEIPFRYEELALFQRNLSPEIDRNGYGHSELEAGVDTLSAFVEALTYTRRGLDENAIPKGILTVFGDFDRRTQQTFISAWQAKLRGVSNAFALPVLFARKGQAAAQFTQTGAPFSEMAFAKWISLQASILGAIYGIDPREVGIEGFSADKATLSGDDTAERLASSRDQGLEPFLADLEGFLSDDLLGRFAPWVRFSFTGLRAGDEKAKRELEARVSTLNELRASLQMPPHPLGWFGDLPADPNLLSAEFQRLQSVLTFDEARRVWGGLPAFPEAKVGTTPMNPTLGSAWQQATAPDPGPMGWNGEGDPFDALGEDSEEAAEPEGHDPPGLREDMSTHLRRFRNEEGADA
ncbi:MAG: phage portal protein [Acidobacteria bacterium]|nr:phage portal protein [Acidobacteriota bacterium]